MASRRSFLRRLLGAPVAAAAAVIVPELLKAEPAPLAPVRFGMVTDEILEAARRDADPLWWDYGSSITLASGETFTVTIDHPALTS